MSPVQQIFAQQQSGSAEGQGFGQFFAEGYQQAQKDRQLNLMERRMEQEEQQQQQQSMLLPLQQEALALRNQQTGIEIQKAQQEAKLGVATEAADLAVGSYMSQLTERGLWGTPESWTGWNDIIKSQPYAAISKNGQRFMQQQQLAITNNRLTSQFGSPTTVQAPLPDGGQAVYGGANRPIPEAQRMELARQHGLEVSGVDDQGRASFARPTAGEITEIDPATGRVTITRGGKGVDPSGLTPTQRGTATLQATKLEDVSRRLDDIIAQADNIFGPAAAAQNVVVDQFLANFNPRLAKGERIQGRSKASLVLEGLLVQLGEGQGQLSNKDIERLKGAFPELKNPKEVLFENPENARQILRAIQKELTRDAYVKAQQVKQPPSKEVLRRLSPAFLGEELKAGRISQDQFIEAINNSVHTDEVNALLDSR